MLARLSSPGRGARSISARLRSPAVTAGPRSRYFPCSSRQQSVTWIVSFRATETSIEFAVLFVTWTPPTETVSFGRTLRALVGTRTSVHREGLQELREVRGGPSLGVRDRLLRGRVRQVVRDPRRDPLLVRGHELILVEPPDRDLVPPLPPLHHRLCDLRVNLLFRVDDGVVRAVELVHPREGPPLVLVLPVLPAEPLLRVDVVVRRAGLEDVEERVPLVLDPLADQGDEVLDVVRIPAADPCRARSEGEPQRVHALVHVRGGHRLRPHAEPQGRGRLTLREAIDAVVEDDVQHVYVPAAGVHEVRRADSESVSVAPAHDNIEARVRELQAPREPEGPAGGGG